VGDFIKGPLPVHWPLALRAGARLHRRVDAISNQHPGIRAHCDTYPNHLRRFAPIFVDMLADHCLAMHWHEYYWFPAAQFSSECYAAIDDYRDFLPAQGERFVSYMQDVDLLANYHQWRHVAQGLHSVLRRLNRSHWSGEVERTSLALVPVSREHFNSYFPQLRAAWQTWNVFTALGDG
jgi:acyl carrier protein phosphodiesterase